MVENIEVIRTEIAKLRLEKGDKLIVRIRDTSLPSEAIDAIAEAIKELFPDHEVILVEGDIDFEILRDDWGGDGMD